MCIGKTLKLKKFCALPRERTVLTFHVKPSTADDENKQFVWLDLQFLLKKGVSVKIREGWGAKISSFPHVSASIHISSQTLPLCSREVFQMHTYAGWCNCDVCKQVGLYRFPCQLTGQHPG